MNIKRVVWHTRSGKFRIKLPLPLHEREPWMDLYSFRMCLLDQIRKGVDQAARVVSTSAAPWAMNCAMSPPVRAIRRERSH